MKKILLMSLLALVLSFMTTQPVIKKYKLKDGSLMYKDLDTTLEATHLNSGEYFAQKWILTPEGIYYPNSVYPAQEIFVDLESKYNAQEAAKKASEGQQAQD